MSHTTKINTVKIQSITAIRTAVADLQEQGVRIELLEDAKPRSYSPGQSGMGRAEYVLRLPNATYDVGLYLQKDGSYEARTDFYMGTVAKELGVPARDQEHMAQAQLGKFLQAYGVAAALESARKKGYSARKIVTEDGTVKLELMGM